MQCAVCPLEGSSSEDGKQNIGCAVSSLNYILFVKLMKLKLLFSVLFGTKTGTPLRN